MAQVLGVFTALLAWLRNSQARRGAEILYLRWQLIVLKRAAPTRPRLRATDRLIFICLYRLFPSVIDGSIIFKPETLPPATPDLAASVRALRVVRATLQAEPAADMDLCQAEPALDGPLQGVAMPTGARSGQSDGARAAVCP